VTREEALALARDVQKSQVRSYVEAAKMLADYILSEPKEKGAPAREPRGTRARSGSST